MKVLDPFSASYLLVNKLLNWLYDSDFFTGRLHGPVVSVGSLSAGGAGKTPFVILLGKLFEQHGIEFDVLSRGYGRRSTGALIVDANGTSEEFGDEPLLIARKLNAQVIVGESRFLAGQLSEQTYGPRLHLLDDGFQHRELSRDFDIVLLTAKDLHDRLYPMGLLREPLSALGRAHAIALMDEGMEFRAEPYKLIWRAQRGIRIGATPPKQVAFCGIARPQQFFRQLRAAGLEPAAEIKFSDHHHYTARDVEKLLRARDAAKATGFVTTEKDVINLRAFAEKLAPLHVIEVRMELDEPELALEAIQAEIDARARSVA